MIHFRFFYIRNLFVLFFIMLLTGCSFSKRNVHTPSEVFNYRYYTPEQANGKVNIIIESFNINVPEEKKHYQEIFFKYLKEMDIFDPTSVPQPNNTLTMNITYEINSRYYTHLYLFPISILIDSIPTQLVSDIKMTCYVKYGENKRKLETHSKKTKFILTNFLFSSKDRCKYELKPLNSAAVSKVNYKMCKKIMIFLNDAITHSTPLPMPSNEKDNTFNI